MKRLWLAPFCATAMLAWAEEPPVPQIEEESDRQVPDILLTEGDLEPEIPPITLKQLTPKETISLDQAVDMPSDI